MILTKNKSKKLDKIIIKNLLYYQNNMIDFSKGAWLFVVFIIFLLFPFFTTKLFLSLNLGNPLDQINFLKQASFAASYIIVLSFLFGSFIPIFYFCFFYFKYLYLLILREQIKKCIFLDNSLLFLKLDVLSKISKKKQTNSYILFYYEVIFLSEKILLFKNKDNDFNIDLLEDFLNKEKPAYAINFEKFEKNLTLEVLDLI